MTSPFRSFYAKAYQTVFGASAEPEITVEQFKSLLEAKEEIAVLDVREDWERETCLIEPSAHIPLMQLPERIGELDPQKPTIVYCKVGGRSARAVGFLRKAGFKKAVNLEGGIDAWAEKIEPAMPRY